MKNNFDTFETFKKNILADVENCPKSWRKGQAVFNILDEIGLARTVQFFDNVDCFYNDDNIDDFIAHAYVHYVDYIQRENQEENENA